jgi:HlyD family secretion protein
MAVVTDTSLEHPIEAPRTAAPPEAMPPPAKRRWPYVAALVVLGLAGLGIARALPHWFSGPPPQIVTASGRIEGREVTVAPKDIQGRVKRLLVDEGQTVSKGQLLAELDAAQLEARYATVSANIANLDVQINQAALDVSYTAKNSGASIAAAEAAVSSAQAHLARAQAVLANSTSVYDRAVTLFRDAVISKQEFDQANLSRRTSDADVAAAEKDLARAEADLTLARASKDTIGLKQQHVRALQASRRAAVGQLAEARANLAERQILAPTDGTILSRPVEVGDVVSPGSPVFVMVDMSRLYLKVYVPEPDIPKLRLGDPADVSVDAFPHRTFPARVSKISDQAEFTPKNVETAEERLKLVFGVELTFINPDRVLKPGMPADGVIHWASSGPDGTRHGS